MKSIKQYNPAMSYRRFGKTEKRLSVITLGGMRFVHGWNDPREDIPEETLEEVGKSIQMAFQHGINHIETAYGYKKSETAFGKALNDLLAVPRDSYYLMTKGNPQSASEVRPLVEQQLKALKTDYLDFYAWHGINHRQSYETACCAGGPVEELLKLKEEGVIGHVGFSTHGPLDVICDAVQTDLFDFVNLHYYYFFQRNRGAVDLAQMKDMGVFIISPNDKGGRLYDPPEKLKELTKPYTPLQWNARFCLSSPAVHTLSFGITAESHFREMAGILPLDLPLPQRDGEIRCELDRQLLADPFAGYEGYEFPVAMDRVNVPEFLRLRRLWKCYDMLEFGKYRYNMHSPTDHWVPGKLASDEELAALDCRGVPEGLDLKALLREAHKAFFMPEKEKG